MQKSYKVIKNTIKIWIVIVGVLFLIPTLTLFVLHNKRVQTYVVNKQLTKWADEAPFSASVKQVKVGFLGHISLYDIVIKADSLDTVLHVPKISLYLNPKELSNQLVNISKVNIYRASVNINKLKDSTYNYQSILDSLQGNKKQPSGWIFKLEDIHLKKCSFNYNNTIKPSNSFQIQNLYNTINISSIKKDSIVVHLKRLSFKSLDLFNLKNLETKITATPSKVSLSAFKANTKNSSVRFDMISVVGNKLLDKRDKWKISSFKIQNSKNNIQLNELSFLNRKLKNHKEHFIFNLSSKGTPERFNLKNTSCKLYPVGSLDFNAEITDLLNKNSFGYHFNFNELNLNIQHLSNFLQRTDSSLVIPQRITRAFTKINYTGSIDGSLTEITSKGQLTSNLGAISTDLNFEKDSTNQKSFFTTGKIKTKGFNVGAILPQKHKLGQIALESDLEFFYESDTTFGLHSNTFIMHLDYQGYRYKNIDIEGFLANNKFDGALGILDENVQANLSGAIDFSNGLKKVRFNANVHEANLDALKLSIKQSNANLSFNAEANLAGTTLDNTNGFFKISDIAYANPRGNIDIDSFKVEFKPNNILPFISIQSPLLNGEITGKYHFSSLSQSIQSQIQQKLPSLANQTKPKQGFDNNNFSFKLTCQPLDTLARILDLPYYIYSTSTIQGGINDKLGQLNFNASIPLAAINNVIIDRLQVNLQNSPSTPANFRIQLDEFGIKNRRIENIVLKSNADNDIIYNQLVWNKNEDVTNSGNLKSSLSFEKTTNNKLKTRINILPSNIIINDSIWGIPQSQITVAPKHIKIDSLSFINKNSKLVADGILSENEESLQLNVSNLHLSFVHDILKPKKTSFNGILNGQMEISHALKKPLIETNFLINKAEFNEKSLGDIDLESYWNEENNLVEIDLINTHEGQVPVVSSGTYNPTTDNLDLEVAANELNINFLSGYLQQAIQNPEGLASGNIQVLGPLKKPHLHGGVFVRDGSMKIEPLNTNYYFSDSVLFAKNEIIFDSIIISDYLGNIGILDGELKHEVFKNFHYNLNASVNNFTVLRTKPGKLSSFYGSIYADALCNIHGNNEEIFISAQAKTRENSYFSLPVTRGKQATVTDFITFTTPKKEEITLSKKELMAQDLIAQTLSEISNTKLNIDIQVEATPGAKVEIIFDRTVGDILSCSGSGNLRFNYSSDSELKMAGVYTINKGDYLFTLQNIVNKRFKIDEGSAITWGGTPFDAILDINAVYSTKASLYDLLPTQFSTSDSRKRLPVETHLIMKESLLQPNIEFSILLPTADQETESTVEGIINTKDELNRQVLSLLLLNRFYTPDYMQNALADGGNSSTQSQAAWVTASEMLTSQLSNWISQISNDFDFNFSYMPGDEITSNELELALSTILLDDRVEINGNFGYREQLQNTQTSNFVGDFDVFVKLNNEGNVKFKAYTHSNDEIFYDTSPTIQGVGIIYKEDFNNLKDLVAIIRERKAARKKKRKEKKANPPKD